MFFHHDDHRRFAATLTTSRCIDAASRQLARVLQHPSLFRSPAVGSQRPPPIAINLNHAPDGPSAVTLHCAQAGISERRPLRTRHASSARFTATTGDERALLDQGETSTLALTLDLTPLVRLGPTLATRAILFVHFVREPWWSRDLTDALSDLADLWLRRLAAQAHATTPNHRGHRTQHHPTRTIAVLAPIPAPPSV